MNRDIDCLQSMQGLSYQTRLRFQNIILQRIADVAPWTEFFDDDDFLRVNPIGEIRNAVQGLKCILETQLNSDMLFGHSPYNYSAIGKPIRCAAPHIAHTKYNIPIGELYYEFTDPVTVCLTGDGGILPRVPYGTPTTPIAFLRVLSLNDTLQHCRHSGIPVLLSSLSDKNPIIEKWLDKLSKDLKQNDTFSLYCTKKKIHCIYNYIRTDNGDWQWSHRYTTKSVAPGAHYCNVGLTRWKNGQYKHVKNQLYKNYHALVCKFTRDNEDNKDEKQLEEEKWTGYRLTTPKVAATMAQMVELCIQDYYANNPDIEFDYKKDRELRVEFAKIFKHGFLYKGDKNCNYGLFDCLHCWWSWQVKTEIYFFKWLWCIQRLSKQNYLFIVSQLGVPWIAKQLKKYIEDINPNRDVDIDLELHTNGDINKYCINGFPYALTSAAKILDEINQQNGRQNESNTLHCCILIRISSLMRKGFATLLTDKFVMNEDGTCDAIEDMINNIQLATYLSYHLFDELVCIY